MIVRSDSARYREVLPGVQLKTLVHGDRTLLAEFRLAEGAVVPVHSHPQEQTGYLLSGRLRFTSGDDVMEVGPGDAWSFAADQEHGAEVLEDTVVVEVFSPVREDYLDEPGRPEGTEREG